MVLCKARAKLSEGGEGHVWVVGLVVVLCTYKVGTYFLFVCVFKALVYTKDYVVCSVV